MTTTSDFGTGKRESHDAEKFYSRLIQPDIKISDDTFVDRVKDVDQIYCKSSEKMDELPSNSVALCVTSPPYNVGKQGDDDLTLEQYFALMESVFGEVYRVLEPGGRVAVNVANVGRKPYIPLVSYFWTMLEMTGFLPRGEILWIKGRGQSSSCAWGTFMSPKNPTLRDLHEYILVASKGRYDRVTGGETGFTDQPEDKRRWMNLTLSVWEMRPESAKKIGHPAPFPVELPQRLIELYTYEHDVVLDPFSGSGTAAVAAKKTNRHFILYDTNSDYCDLARRRLDELPKRSVSLSGTATLKGSRGI